MKVLIGSNGGLTGIYLSKRLSKRKDVVLFGADSSKVSPGKFFVKKQFYLPRVDSNNFLDELVKLINDEGIDMYIPTHSKETKFISCVQDELLKRTKCSFIISPYSTYEALDDKRNCNQNLKRIGIPVPKIIDSFNCTYPIFMKSNVGSGGVGRLIIENKEIHKAFFDTKTDVCFYELIDGVEFTVDCLFNKKGKLLLLNQRVREKTIGGAALISKSNNEFNIKPYILQISSHWKFCGCVNFQYILRDNTPYFIDINLRFPSGGLPVTVEQGYDIPNAVIDLLSNKPLHKFCPRKKNVRMYRYFEEIFEKL